jgi:O-acetyl-ADP-ribose deacetylase (regulator of RNase III)
MGKQITYLKGDATAPSCEGKKVICHICNDIGGWGAGFVLAISKRWKEPETQYRKWYKEQDKFKLGEISLVQVEPEIYIANMIGQRGTQASKGVPPIRYEAVEQCLDTLSEKAAQLNASVHMPRIGCGLAGGKWEEIEPLIQKTLIQKGIDVFVYDFQ